MVNLNKKHILVCTNFVTKWVEAAVVTFATENVVVDFLFNEIFTRFGVPREIVSDNGLQFVSNLVQEVMNQYKIQHRKSTPYHPQANGQVESTDKVIESILTKTVNTHRKDWAEKLRKHCGHTKTLGGTSQHTHHMSWCTGNKSSCQ